MVQAGLQLTLHTSDSNLTSHRAEKVGARSESYRRVIDPWDQVGTILGAAIDTLWLVSETRCST